jgi:hypothetical protein
LNSSEYLFILDTSHAIILVPVFSGEDHYINGEPR